MSFRCWPLLGTFVFTWLTLAINGATLVPTGTTWRWRTGSSEASTPVGAWRAAGFVDTEFTSAPAPFWYGDVLEGGTQIQGMQNNYGCIFLRMTFQVPDATAVGSLSMTALVDDGFVAWINGTEVLRVNMPGEAGSDVTRGTLANNASEPVSFATYALPSPGAYLVNGTNVLAVQVFQSALSSSDLGFDASLDATVRETVPPRILSVTPAPGTAIESLTQWTVKFSEPVDGVVAAHLLINGIGAADVVAIDEATYVYRFAQPAYGTVNVAWNPQQTITDRAQPPNRFDATAAEAHFQYTLLDRSPPLVAGTTPLSGSFTRELGTISVLFSEPVSGVDATDLLINGQPATAVTAIAASQYLFTVGQTATGVVRVAWSPSHEIMDQASPPNLFGGGEWIYRFDPNAPEAQPYISEFMASNTRTLRDETGDYPDWIELHNPSEAPVNLEGWYLTDSTNNLTKWRFPATNLLGHGFLVVRASGKDHRTPGAPLHTSFQLGSDGESLALVRPDGVTVVSEYGPKYPRQVQDVSYGVIQIPRGEGWDMGASGVYFLAPTPGNPNLGGTAVPGPIVATVTHAPNVPGDEEDLVVTARVLPTFAAVASVELRYRVQFGAEVPTPMLDDGAHGDGAARDGVYGAVIPAAASNPGQMVRYYLVATDVAAKTSRWPLFTDPVATEEYLGTIVEPTNAVSQLPVFHLFVAPTQLSRIDSESGGRASFFYDGEFYDNISVEVRGNTSAGLNKKSHRIEFNRGHELRHAGPGGRTRRSSLLAEHLDPTFLRHHLCFWLLNNVGNPAPYFYPVRVHLNGLFYQLAFHNDVIGKEQVERFGYDPSGALYKAVGNLVPNFSSTGVFQKLEPEDDPSRTDYLELANGINESAPLEIRRKTVFDLLDVPQVINHLAATRWCAENDDVWANMSLYRDTYGDGLWRNIPFDMNASWGQLYGGSSPLEATVDFSKSHPLYGGSSTEPNFNRLYDVIVSLPETRQMLLRRERSIMDRWIQPPETPVESRILENYVRHMTNLISNEAHIDRARWGTSPWAPGKSFEGGVGDLINQFIVPRRRHWYVTHSITNTARAIGIRNSDNAGIPLAQPADARLVFAGLEFNPSSGNQSQEYIVLSNASPVAVDLTDWKIAGAVNFTFKPGTVVPTNGRIYVSPDVRQFRARTSGPRGGLGLFVVGPYTGQLSARGETLTLTNELNQAVDTYSFQGAPSPAQQFLRVTEIQFHPAPAPGHVPDAEEFEFIELRNISSDVTLDLRGVRFVTGVVFDFTGGRITTLGPGARVLVVANAVAFASRYGDGLPVAGEAVGRLDNGGERLRLVDATNEEILDFTYKDTWQPSADGGGYSLVVVDEGAAPDAWSDRSQWKASGKLNGTPGAADEAGPGPARQPQLEVQTEGTLLVLRFLAASNQTYTLQTSGALPALNWDRRQDVEAAGSDRAVEWRLPFDSEARYFRLTTPKQP
ncbi:MAG: lamin tail domain-containing protein [Verrucomicrobiales bacterium]|nr:lamin tail domain-containing protein [Verrucomicrobiales bacterium]